MLMINNQWNGKTKLIILGNIWKQFFMNGISNFYVTVNFFSYLEKKNLICRQTKDSLYK